MSIFNFHFYEEMKRQYELGVEMHTYIGCPMCNARPLADIAYG
jgi:hypothetical protein